MLILQRRIGESLMIGEEIRVSVVSIEGGRVRLAISAPPEVSILRSELLDAKYRSGMPNWRTRIPPLRKRPPRNCWGCWAECLFPKSMRKETRNHDE